MPGRNGEDRPGQADHGQQQPDFGVADAEGALQVVGGRRYRSGVRAVDGEHGGERQGYPRPGWAVGRVDNDGPDAPHGSPGGLGARQAET
jgi:hypothetical protein